MITRVVVIHRPYPILWRACLERFEGVLNETTGKESE
jgi:hypothetical protein